MSVSEWIEIDGSYGEGGGQILRTSLSLSCLLQRPLRIFNIRKGRKNAGLMPQHLTAVRSMQLISSAEVKGAEKGSTELYFKPAGIKSGNLFFDIGTAGSTMLVFQTVLPCLCFCNKKGFVTIKGGTHVPLSPCYEYVSNVFTNFLQKMGITIKMTIDQYGFYPAGGGVIRSEIEPVSKIKLLKLLEPGRLIYINGISGVANLPVSIAERQRDAFFKAVKENAINVETQIQTKTVNSIGKGTFLYVEAITENSIAGFSSLGEKGKSAESIGIEVANQFLKYIRSSACLDPHMADQIVLYAALSDGETEFTTSEITEHLRTNLWILKKFIDIEYRVTGEVGNRGIIKIRGLGSHLFTF